MLFRSDGLLYPLVYERIVGDQLSIRGGAAVAMLTQFMNDWFDETRKWVDAVLKVAAAESGDNREVLQEWIRTWSSRAASAIVPVIELGLGSQVDEAVGEELAAFTVRMERIGITI